MWKFLIMILLIVYILGCIRTGTQFMGIQLTKICNKCLTTVSYIRVSDTLAENQRKNK